MDEKGMVKSSFFFLSSLRGDVAIYAEAKRG